MRCLVLITVLAVGCQAPDSWIPPETCYDGVEDTGETGVDCGGTCPQGCGPRQCFADDSCCSSDDDCATGLKCRSGFCGVRACADQTDCADGFTCSANSPDAAKFCSYSDGCSDGTHTIGLGETDVDCGGAICPLCKEGKHCYQNIDCDWSVGLVCGAGNICQRLACSDNGASCDNALHPPARPWFTCQAGTCTAPSCRDGVKNGIETDVDCGGESGTGPGCNSTCRPGQKCGRYWDCLDRGACNAGICQAPTCTDGVKNGAGVKTEWGIDCGDQSGTCPGCHSNTPCQQNYHCASGVCHQCALGDHSPPCTATGSYCQ